MITLLKSPSTNNYWKNGVMPYQVAALKAYLSPVADITVDDLEIKVWMHNHLNPNDGIDLRYFHNGNVLAHLFKQPDQIIEEYGKRIIKLINNLENPIIAFYIETADEFLMALTLSQLLKKMGKSIFLVGAYFKTVSSDLMEKFEFIDFIFSDSGELSLEAFFKKTAPEDVPNLTYRMDGKVLQSKGSKIIHQNFTPIPDFSGLPFKAYKTYNSVYFGYYDLVMSYRVSQGCKYDCFFCGSPKYDYFNVKKAYKPALELKALVEKFGTNKFFFYDNSLTFSEAYINSFCDEISNCKLDINYVAFAHYGGLTLDGLQKLRQSGCLGLCFGVESTSLPSILNLQKNKDQNTLPGILADCKKAGIWAHLFFQCGLPGQKLEHIKKDLSFIKSNMENINSILINRFQLFINSEIYNNPSEHGIDEFSHRLAPYFRNIPNSSKNEELPIQHKVYLKAIRELKLINFEPDRTLSFLLNKSGKKSIIDLIKDKPVMGTEEFLQLCRYNYAAIPKA